MPTSALGALAKDATLGAAGDSPPPLASNASGLLGLVRRLVDLAVSVLVQLGASATGNEYTRIGAGVDGGGVVRAVGVDSSGRVAIKDVSDAFGVPAGCDCIDIGATNTNALNADSSRRYLILQNVHASDVIRWTFSTGANPASATNGLLLGPGQSWEGPYTSGIQAISPAGARTAMLARAWW